MALVHDALNCTSAHPPASFEELKELLRILRGQTVELPVREGEHSRLL